MQITTARPRIAAVIVTHAGGSILLDCLQSLAEQTRPPDEVLVVVSNHALDVPAPALQIGENVGYARAANLGAAATRGEILLLNDDTRLLPDCVEALERAWAGAGVYQPRIRLADGSGRLDNLGLGFFPDGAVWARGRLGPDVAIEGRPGAFSGAAVLFGRSWWDELGGFDERLGSFCEDVDLSLRLMRRGRQITAVPDAIVEHHLGATWGRSGAEKIRLIERNRIRVAARSLPASAVLALPISTLARYLLFAGLGAAGRGPGSDVGTGSRIGALRGLAEGFAGLPRALADRAADRPYWTLSEREMWRELVRGRARWEDVCR